MVKEMNSVNVRLSAFGESYLKSTGGGPLRVLEGNHESAFQPGEIKAVTREEWEKILSKVVMAGTRLFELVEDPQPDPPAAAAQVAA